MTHEHRTRVFCALGCVTLLMLPVREASAERLAGSEALAEQTTRLVVHFKTGAPATIAQAGSTPRKRLDKAILQARGSALTISGARAGAASTAVLRLSRAVSVEEARALGSEMAAADPDILLVEPDLRVYTQQQFSVNDPEFPRQWALNGATGSNTGGASFVGAWGLIPGAPVAVAVIDSGYLPHVDLPVPSVLGRNFISDTQAAGNGVGRSIDPADIGDYCDSEKSDSTWHGLKVSGVIGALTNNGTGVAGAVSPYVQVLPIRVIGRCGAFTSDIADAISWAAGAPIAGFGSNNTPVRVINLSLGTSAGSGCPKHVQDAINTALARGIVVVAAAGNDGAHQMSSPAYCSGVIAVAAHTQSGDLAKYSNRSVHTTLTGPAGGECAQQRGTCNSVEVTTLGNAGKRSAEGDTIASFSGTSAATAHVSAAAALLVAAEPNLTPSQVRSVLVNSARPHAGDSYCATETRCGAGMLDATAALANVSSPLLDLKLSTRTVSVSAPVVLTATVTGGKGVAPYTFEWIQTSGPTVQPNVAQDANGRSTLQFTAPAVKGDPIRFNLRVTSANGLSARDQATVDMNNAPIIKAPTDAQLQAGHSLSKFIEVTDPDNDRIELVLTQAPVGAQVEGTTVLWSNATAGVHRFTLYATDGNQQSATVSFNVTVSEGPETTTGGGATGLPWVLGLLVAALALHRPSSSSRARARVGESAPW